MVVKVHLNLNNRFYEVENPLLDISICLIGDSYAINFVIVYKKAKDIQHINFYM